MKKGKRLEKKIAGIDGLKGFEAVREKNYEGNWKKEKKKKLGNNELRTKQLNKFFCWRR